MTRNPNATCSTCVYWCGERCRSSSDFHHRVAEDWCGEHPEFEEAQASVPVLSFGDEPTECKVCNKKEVYICFTFENNGRRSTHGFCKEHEADCDELASMYRGQYD